MIVNIVLKDNDNLQYDNKVKFLIVIPAHNEELFIQRILKSIVEQNYPVELFNIIVVADNCTDNTATIASGENIEVLIRKNTKDYGKGHAIKYALDNSDNYDYDALFIIDADSVINKNGLASLNRQILNGKRIIQCNNAVANPGDSWFTQLMNVARTIGNEIQEPAKEKLGLSSHLMGNGMCFKREIIEKYGWSAFSVGEDWEYYAIVINEGERIAFAQDVRVFHQESTSLKQATPQRMRWSSGRFAVLKQYGLGLFWRGLIERNLLKLDASLPLIFPNPSLAMEFTVLGLIPSLFFFVTDGDVFWVVLFAILAIFQMLLFMSGVFYTRNKLRSFLSIFIAPLFLVWKMIIDILSIVGVGRKKWVRTNRHL
ncbi:MAG: glycosyltransferase [Desulfobacteraceae bacterium]|nr:glycosyltransferase [Desulfobacteraceae bacterium]MBC2754844.1 glycosyltransferase [Desulfobacteraceae bacterium]